MLPATSWSQLGRILASATLALPPPRSRAGAASLRKGISGATLAQAELEMVCCCASSVASSSNDTSPCPPRLLPSTAELVDATASRLPPNRPASPVASLRHPLSHILLRTHNTLRGFFPPHPVQAACILAWRCNRVEASCSSSIRSPVPGGQ